MSWLFGSHSGKQSDRQYPDTRLRIQSSVAGKVRPIVYGRVRLAPSLIWEGDFFSASGQAAGGKGVLGQGGSKGGGGVANYTYAVSILYALCEGPIAAINSLWKDNWKTKQPFHAGGFATAFLGTYSQSAWAYLVSKHPTQAIPYRGLACVGLEGYFLGNSSTLPNVSYEVESSVHNGYAGVPDADPKDVITDYLTNPHYGVGFPSAYLGDLTAFSNYCIASGFVISDALVSPQTANDYLKALLTAMGCEFVWSSGKLGIVPYGTTSITGNGATFAPVTASSWDFSDDDYLANKSPARPDGTRDPVVCTRKRQSDALNSIKVEYFDRTKNYDPAVVEAKNDAAIALFGLRPSDTKQHHFFCQLQPALASAHVLLARQNVRNTYRWTADERFIFLDPMDIVTLTDAGLGLSQLPVRILEITDNGDASLTFAAEEIVDMSPVNITSETPDTAICACELPNAYPGVTVFDWLDAPLSLVKDGPALQVFAAGSPAACAPGFGRKGIIAFWHKPIGINANPGASRRTLIMDATNGFAVLRAITGSSIFNEIDVVAATDGSGNFFYNLTGTGLLPDGSNVSFFAASQNLDPSKPHAVMIQWDFTGGDWDIKFRVDRAAVVDTLITGVGAPLGYPFFQQPTDSTAFWGAEVIFGDNQTTSLSEQYLSQFWMGLDDDIGDYDIGSDAVFDAFFDATYGSLFAPRDLGADGSAPLGQQPFLYLPHDATSLLVSTGRAPYAPFSVFGSGLAPDSVPAGQIPPAANGYQAVGVHFKAQAGQQWSTFRQGILGSSCNAWGGANVWVATAAGGPFVLVGSIAAPSPIGVVLDAITSTSDPDTTDLPHVDLTESQQQLTGVSNADADLSLTLSKLADRVTAGDKELIAYSGITLTAPSVYRMTGNYIRRGLYGTTPQAWSGSVRFTRMSNPFTYRYPANLIGTSITVKLQPFNTQGNTLDLSFCPTFAVTLAGPGAPKAPTGLTLTKSGGICYASWSANTDAGVSGYTLTYVDHAGGSTVTVCSDSNVLQATVTGLTAGHTYDFTLTAVNSAGQASSAATASITM